MNPCFPWRRARASLRARAPLVWACAIGALLGLPVRAHAAPGSVFLQLGRADDRATALGAGVRWPLDGRPALLGLHLTTAVDLGVSAWRTRRLVGEPARGFAVASAVPVVRLTLDQGRSPWFVESGIGLAWINPRYRAGARRFSTAWNFADQLALGYRLDARRELSLRLEHVSNGGVRKPNPGENFVQLRYGFSY